MADIVEEMTAEQLRDALRGLMSAFVLALTGDVWDATDADGADLVLEAAASYVSTLRTEFNDLGNELLPGPDSPYLADMVALLGITPEAGESNASLWSKRALVLTEASLGSPVALRDLLTLSVDGVADVSFVTQSDGSQNVYLVSELDPPSGENPGIPTTAQNAAALALMNNGRSRHVGRPFTVVGPTATLYSIVMTVYYYAGATPDVGALQTRLGESLEAFVVDSRRLGVALAQSNLYDAARVEGVSYVAGAFYTDSLQSGNPTPLELLDPADSSVFHTCAASVNTVAMLSAGADGEINLIWTALS